MGKPFSKEILKIYDTYQWALNVPIEDLEYIQDFLLKKNLLVIGSGGSTCSCALFSMLHQQYGKMANFITPLELQYFKNTINNELNVVFISAGGKNSDILFAFETALSKEPSNILSICLTKNSPLSEKSSKYSISKTINLENPAGKDGFLATNSTIAYFTLISRFYGKDNIIKSLKPSKSFFNEISDFSEKLHEDFTIILLFSGWSKPVALDIESKFSEAGLGNVLLSDYRNFGHGRHNWLDKKKEQSAIIALVTVEDKDLAYKTLGLLPDDIPVLKIISDYDSNYGSLELLIKSFYLVEEIGKLKMIDPGRPGVPSYGSKMYHLKYSKFYNEKKNDISQNIKLAIKRKFGDTEQISNKVFLPSWIDAYKRFTYNLNKAVFRGIIMDYDGTICSSKERYGVPRPEVVQKIEFFLENEISIGVVTGRGKSVRESLQKLISKKYWDKFLIGYYNGAQIGSLNNNSLPERENDINLFSRLAELLNSERLIKEFTIIDLRKGQLTITIKDKINSEIIKNTIRDFLKKSFPFEIQILESSHSIDIISIETSKNLMLDYCREQLGDIENKFNFLFIGDKGKWPGNDFQLLSNTFSLSVDEVSSDPETCWNLSSLGNNCVESTLEYFDSIYVLKNGMFKIKF